MRVLLVEDDVRLAAAVLRGLRAAAVVADHAPTAADAAWMVRAAPLDAVVLDLGLPDGDGVDLCRRLRDERVAVPILMLTARDAVGDRIRGLDAGADDYLTKPFSLDELLARLRALARRGTVEPATVLRAGGVVLDPAARTVTRDGVAIDLSARELALLEAFLRRPGIVMSQSELLEAAWDLGYEARSNVVEVYVRYLREKIDRPFGVQSIETVRGLGYRLRADGGG